MLTESYNENDFFKDNLNYFSSMKLEKITSKDDEREPVLNIKTTLIKPEQVKSYGNRLTEDIQYEKAGGNGVFDAVPKLVKIKGFELNKKITVKIQLVNKSKFSQRLSIVPPTTPFFKIKFSRRGLIPPGLSELIVLSFTPQNYAYYYDYIRVICEGDKMIIPIHAFPKMNIHMKEYVPKYLDFGTIAVNTVNQRELILKNIVDIPFEYEIVPIKSCDEIKVEPVVGEIDSLCDKIITFKFAPQSYGIFQSEYEFRLSEMDYKPVIINITGSCNVFDKVLNENIMKHMKKLKESQNNMTIDLSSNKKILKNSKITLNEVNESNIENSINNIVSSDHKTLRFNKESTTNLIQPENKTPQVENSTQIEKFSTAKGLSKKYKNFPSNKEREFLNYFNMIDNKIKDKEIKYIQFIGKKLLNADEINKIISDRISEFESNLMMKRKIDINRHSFENDSEKCCVDRNNEYLMKPTFNSNLNDKFFKTRHYFSIFLKNMTKVLINNRAQKRLDKIQEMINKNNINNPNDFGNYMEKEWVNQFTKESESSNENNTKLKFIAPGALSRGEVYLSYDYNLETLKQNITHENNINLDELREFDKLERSEMEALGYREFRSNGITLYEISTQDKILRTCAESERFIRGERGDSEMAYDKVLSIIEMPDSYKNHIETNIDTLLFNNPTFKKFVNYVPYPETSIDYNLQPRELPPPSYNELYTNYPYELYKSLPLSIYENLPIKEIDNINLIADSSLDFITNKLPSADQKDLYIKNKEIVDEDNYIFDLVKEDEEKLMYEFEKDNEVMKVVRELNKEEIFDVKTKEKIKLENYLIAQKRKWMATIPTILENYNSSIINPSNKFML